MDVLTLIVVAVAITYAIRGAGHGVQRSYQRRMKAWAKAHPKASGIAQRAAALGQMAAVVRYGGPAIRHGWRHGWADGWKTGKEWALRHRPEPAAAQPDPEPAPEPEQRQEQQGPPPKSGADVIWPPQPNLPSAAARRPDGRPDLRAVPTTKQPATPAPNPTTPTTREADMAIATATGGEVTTPEQLAAELRTIVQEASAELDDAAADAKRAQEDFARVERMVASVKGLQFPPADVAMVQGLLEPAKARENAANARKAAAETRLAQANAALQMANRHVELTGVAAGGFYQAG